MTVPKHAVRRNARLTRANMAAALHFGVLMVTFVLALLNSTAPTALALEPTTPLANLGRQGWATENGLPQNTVQALAQTRDGFLWLGTEVGLVRFDGNSFAVFDQRSHPALPGNDVQCLLAAQDGSLWIGTSDGLAQLKDGAMTVFTTANGLPGNNIQRLFLNGAAVVAVTENALGKIEDGKASWDSTIYEELRVEPLQNSRFRITLPNGRIADANSTTFAIDQGHGQSLHFNVGRELPGTRIQALFADREGSLWIGTNGGLARYVAGKLEKLPVTDPLATASVLSSWKTAKAISGSAPNPPACRSCAISASAPRPHTTAWPATTPRPLWKTARARCGWAPPAAASPLSIPAPTPSQKRGACATACSATSCSHWPPRPTAICGWARRTASAVSVTAPLPHSLQPTACPTTSFARCWPTLRFAVDRHTPRAHALDRSRRFDDRPHADLHLCQRAGQRPGGRDGARLCRGLVGRDTRRSRAPDTAANHQLHHCKRPLQQRHHRHPSARRRDRC